MTLEEATEEILRGPFTVCTHCGGKGRIGYEETSLLIHDEVTVLTKRCESCKGHGKWERGDYLRACVELNLEPQRLPKFPSYITLPPLSAEVFRDAVERIGSAEMNPVFKDQVDAILYAVQSIKSKP